MGVRVILGVLTVNISIAWLPIDKKSFLEVLILDPIKMHVGGLWPFFFNGVVGETVSS